MSAPVVLSNQSPACSTSSDSREKLQDLLNAVTECHETALQELLAKVNKLKKERCLDAQRLSEFHSKNQQLREQQKILQERIKQLEDRVRSGPCDRCALTEEQIKKTNAELESSNQKNLSLTSDFEAETLKDENRRLRLELERLKRSNSPQNVSTEAEEGMIPDSPLRPLSLPVSKMKRRKEQNHVRYAEKPLSFSLTEAKKVDPAANSVLVAETCEMDVTCVPEIDKRKHRKTVVPETCRMDVYAEQDSESDDEPHTPQRNEQNHDCTAIDAVDKSENSPSILPSGSFGSREQPPTDGVPHTPLNNNTRVPVIGKRKHTDSRNREERNSDNSLDDPDETGIKGLIFASTPANCNIGTKKPEMPQRQSQTAALQTHQDLKKRKCLEPDLHSQRRSSVQNQNNMPFPNDQSWSVDPGAHLSQYDTESSPHPEPRAEVETMDTDCTFISHSLLLRNQMKTGQHQMTGIGRKANDSLADIFDKTAYGEYESCPPDESSDHDQDNPYEEEREEEEREEEEEELEEEEEQEPVAEFCRPLDRERVKANGDASNRNRSFACVEVVRKKDERRKLQGHYCKECEIYYAHLPEEERQKKLSSCSRHRFRYIPPSTPENFWEVGFPSTQTCVERGYIKEDNQTDVRMRRRRPYIATFSPKAKSQNKQH